MGWHQRARGLAASRYNCPGEQDGQWNSASVTNQMALTAELYLESPLSSLRGWADAHDHFVRSNLLEAIRRVRNPRVLHIIAPRTASSSKTWTKCVKFCPQRLRAPERFAEADRHARWHVSWVLTILRHAPRFTLWNSQSLGTTSIEGSPMLALCSAGSDLSAPLPPPGFSLVPSPIIIDMSFG